MRLLDEGVGLRRRPLFAYALALAACGIGLALRVQLDGVLPTGFPFLTFFPAVILTAFLAGTGPAILCAVVCGVAAWYMFIPPTGTFALDGGKPLALAFYVFIVSIDILLIHLMQVATERLRVERERTAALYEAQRTLFQELQHRVANNMAFVGALLQMQRRKLGDDPQSARAAIDGAMDRIEILSRVHRRLYDPQSVERPIDDYLRELLGDLIEASDAGRIEAVVEAPDIRMDITRLMTVSLLVTEIVTNSLKHAFVGRDEGRITLTIAAAAPGRLRLSISDDGRGLPDGHDAGAGPGLGHRIAESLARQLGGRIETRAGAGLTTQVEFAA